jgi:hypothetical protein
MDTVSLDEELETELREAVALGKAIREKKE